MVGITLQIDSKQANRGDISVFRSTNESSLKALHKGHGSEKVFQESILIIKVINNEFKNTY